MNVKRKIAAMSALWALLVGLSVVFAAPANATPTPMPTPAPAANPTPVQADAQADTVEIKATVVGVAVAKATAKTKSASVGSSYAYAAAQVRSDAKVHQAACMWSSGTNSVLQGNVLKPYFDPVPAYVCPLVKPITSGGVTYTHKKLAGGTSGSHCGNPFRPSKTPPVGVTTDLILDVKAGTVAKVGVWATVQVEVTVTVDVLLEYTYMGQTHQVTKTQTATDSDFAKAKAKAKKRVTAKTTAKAAAKAVAKAKAKVAAKATAKAKAKATAKAKAKATAQVSVIIPITPPVTPPVVTGDVVCKNPPHLYAPGGNGIMVCELSRSDGVMPTLANFGLQPLNDYATFAQPTEFGWREEAKLNPCPANVLCVRVQVWAVSPGLFKYQFRYGQQDWVDGQFQIEPDDF